MKHFSPALQRSTSFGIRLNYASANFAELSAASLVVISSTRLPQSIRAPASNGCYGEQQSPPSVRPSVAPCDDVWGLQIWLGNVAAGTAVMPWARAITRQLHRTSASTRSLLSAPRRRRWIQSPVYTIQPVVKPVDNRVKCLYTRYNRLYRVNEVWSDVTVTCDHNTIFMFCDNKVYCMKLCKW